MKEVVEPHQPPQEEEKPIQEYQPAEAPVEEPFEELQPLKEEQPIEEAAEEVV